MGDVLALPPLNAEELARYRRYQAVRQKLRLRIDRRARELAERDQERYFRAMLFDVYRGAIDPELVPWWEPLAGAVGAPQRKET